MRAEVSAWREQAIADLHTAETNLKEERYYASVFFCQQAVEKALKAYVLKRTRNPQLPEMFSHSLIHLAKICNLPERFHSFLRELTSEYVNTRYPTAAEEPPNVLYDKTIASRTLISAKEVVEWIDKHL
jgi:HEPN domain-containing protein